MTNEGEMKADPGVKAVFSVLSPTEPASHLGLVENFIGTFRMLFSCPGTVPLFEPVSFGFFGLFGVRILLEPEETVYRVFPTLAEV